MHLFRLKVTGQVGLKLLSLLKSLRACRQSTTISTLRVEFPRSQRVALLLQVGRFPVHPIAQGLVDATFVIDVGVL